MDVSFGQLKANLSAYIRTAAAGETITVTLRNRPVARIVAVDARVPPSRLRRIPGLRWNGRKPAGLPAGEGLRKGVALSSLVSRDRR